MSYHYHKPAKDFYKILRVPHTASLVEIKTAYRKLALRLHPDMHQNNASKTKEFQLVNEAYATLSDTAKKLSYDAEIGNTASSSSSSSSSFAHNRDRDGWRPPPRRTPATYYRKVYTARPPPHWKTVWDHQKHYDMHYGSGMQDDAVKQARKRAVRDGAFDYHSPLGPGFTFSNENDEKKNQHDNFNPYSKYSPQGPRTVTFDYEESYVDMQSSKESLRKRERIVEDLHGRREARHSTQQQHQFRQQQQQQQQQQRYHNAAFVPRQRPHGPGSNNGCVIL